MRRLLSLSTMLGLALAAAGDARAQALPTSQPKFLHIVRENVKLGRTEDHAKFEAGWPAAYEKAKFPDYYLALTAVTGTREAWYISPFESQAAYAESRKRERANPALSAELERLSRGDAEHLTENRTIHATGRPDLSHGAYPDLAKMRYWEITLFRVRPGHEAEFAAAAKAYAASAKRSAPKAAWRTYEVVAGLPSPTYIVFSSVESFGEFDRVLAEGEAIMKGFSAEEGAALHKFSADGLVNSETNRFELDPLQSYVAKETRAQDPAFWMPKRPAAAKAPAQP